MINKELSSKVLTIGLQYNDHRGGIGGVIAGYSVYFEKFNFICTYGITTSKIKIVWNYMRSVIKLFVDLLKDKQIKIVHIHGAAKGSVFRKYFIFNISKRIFNKKVIFHSHASEMEVFYHGSHRLVKWLCKDFFGHVDLIICLSNSWKVFYETNFDCKRVEILENIVPDPSFKKNAIPSVPLRLLFLGRVGDRKGIFDLIDVIADNKLTFEGKIHLTIGGDGEGAKLEKIVEERKLNSLVEYKGWISGEQKDVLLESADVYILPSYNEGLPISILEAMSYGLVIVSTKVGGIPEIIVDKENGYLFNPGDKAAIFRTLQNLLDNEGLFETYRARSYNIVENYYPSKVIPKLKKIYESLMPMK